MKNGKESRRDELDRFWDIDALTPRKRVIPTGQADTETTEIEIPAEEDVGGEVRAEHPIPPPSDMAIRRFVPPHTASDTVAVKPLEEYTPDNALIRRVRIFRPKSTYQYYEAFLRDAVRLYPIHGEACERVTFFSYVPQYSQMNRAQLEWYLWWRECVRNGEYPQTDYSYVLLYVYELINLSEHLEPQTVLASLCDVWEHYRDMFRQLDGYLAEWICDFCLLHRTTVKGVMSAALMSAAMAHANLKEFYFATEASDGYAGALIAFCNNYDYKKSKFCAGENRHLFETYMPSVLDSVVELLSEEGKLFSSAHMDDSRMMRNAYTGALCAYSLKRNIEVEYCSFSRSNELRYLITDILKYTENCLRAHLGVRSRLTVYSLPQSIKEHIDAFLGARLPARAPAQKIKKAEEIPAYERLYDLPSQSLSLSHAAEIEERSWRTTERLIEAFEDAQTVSEAEIPPLPVPMPLPTEETDGDSLAQCAGALLPYAAFLQAIGADDTEGQKRAAIEWKMLPDALADKINEICAELTGDILLENDGESYRPLSDYEDLFEDLIAYFEVKREE